MKHQLWINRKLSNWAWFRNSKNQIVFWENCLRKFHKFRFKKARTVNVLYFYLDPTMNYPGLADRIKAMINCFYIAELNRYDFKIIFQSPFKLSQYLQPNEIMWEADEGDLDYSLTDTRFLNYQGKFHSLTPRKQYICFNFHDKVIPELKGRDLLWRQMFHKLFKISPDLEKTCSLTGYAPNSYIAVHLRFLNALGVFEKGCAPLDKKKQENLIMRCRDAIMQLYNENKGVKVVVFSDSSLFLNKISDMPVITMTGAISHLSYSHSEDEVQKTFMDLLLISRALKVYRISSIEMYKSDFPVIAARIGAIDLIDVTV